MRSYSVVPSFLYRCLFPMSSHEIPCVASSLKTKRKLNLVQTKLSSFVQAIKLPVATHSTTTTPLLCSPKTSLEKNNDTSSPLKKNAKQKSTSSPARDNSKTVDVGNPLYVPVSVPVCETVIPEDLPEYSHPLTRGPRFSDWKRALYDIIENKWKRGIYYQNEHFVVAYDGFNKAKHHMLVMVRGATPSMHCPSTWKSTVDEGFDDPFHALAHLRNVTELRFEHLGALGEMHALARRITTHIQQCDPDCLPFFIGYHSIPSLDPLHLHVISMDMESDHLKHRQHWNSFTTPFFLKAKDVEQQLRSIGCVQVDSSRATQYKNQSIVCFGCGEPFGKSFVKLKSHIADGCIRRKFKQTQDNA